MDVIEVGLGHRALNFDPNYIKTIADNISRGEATVVLLQPGDATRYEFYIIPQTDERLRIPGRLPESDWGDYVWIAPINMGNRGGDLVYLQGESRIFYDLGFYRTVHTRKVIAIFLDLVYKAMTGAELIPMETLH